MRNEWNKSDAARMVRDYAKVGIGRDLALRIYTTRLLGQNPALVLHGGGNTSVKTHARDILGDEVEVLCVKGSGWDMGNIEPAGLPAVRLAPLRRLEKLDRLTDEDMVNFQRGQLLDSNAPNPSVETLLHAFMPAKFIDHTHSTAVLGISDQPDGEKRLAQLYGVKMAIVPYIMPGFRLAKVAAEIQRKHPGAIGLILHKHGIFTFGASAEEAYTNMIDMVGLAEERLTRGRKRLAQVKLPKALAGVAEIAPTLRGLTSVSIDRNEGLWNRLVFDFRTGPNVLGYVNGRDVKRYSGAGLVTPDHTIRTKNVPLIVPVPEMGKLDAFRDGAKAAIDKFAADYHAYFKRHNPRHKGSKVELDPMPRVILVPGLGLFGLGKTAKDAAIAADIACNAIDTIADAEAIGRFESIAEADMFDVEYWSLEQAKLGKSADKPFTRQIAIVTGGGGGIGAATAEAFAREGAEVAVFDRDGEAARATATKIGGTAFWVAVDVTNAAAVRKAFDKVVARFGGVDIVVSNAGAAWQGGIGEVSEAVLRQSFELNFFAHQVVAQNAVRVMKAQGTGGSLMFNVSKQAVNPGPDFGPYGLPKATTLFLSRQYALEYGADGIRVNAINADRVHTGIFAGGLLEQRARARGVTVQQYLADGNLLKREVRTTDVAQAFVMLAQARKTTAAVLTVDGGNIAAALR